MRRSRIALVLLLTALAGCAAPSPAGPTASPSASAASERPTASASPAATPTATPGVKPTPVETSTASGAPAPPLAPGAELTLGRLLGLLTVVPEDRTGYDRSLFRLWIDADGDGCDTRREVLIDEAVVAPTVGGGCSLLGGRWVSLYDGLVLTDASQLQIDHVVALAEAWDSGASAWTADRRMRFANDLDVSWALIAVSGASNQSKSDRDPADWLPPDAGDLCPFVSAWIAVKVRWDLSVDQRERDALSGLVRECPNSGMPFEPVPPAGEGTPTALASGVDCSPAYPNVCIPPPPPDLNCGDIAYRRFTVLPPDPHGFDGDKDGVGCES
ncbi:MAG: HNH endonuclease [Chloroflexi bacterium]|nr:HNH endonuclease [Chloroflexota bacterium]